MGDPLFLIALALLGIGIIGSVLPLLPGALTSLAGVYLYWWSTGFTEPGLFALVALTAIGLITFLLDFFGGAISARAGGASLVTTGLASVVGLVLLFFTGPVGLLVGIAGTVFVAEYYRNSDARTSARTALYATVGVLASSVAQLLLTTSMLVVFLLVVL